MISELAGSIASYAIVSIAYANLVGLMRNAQPRYRQLVIGAILGAGALLCALAQHQAGPLSPITDGIVTVGLAQPFGGGLATLVAGLIAAASVVWLEGGPAYPGLAEIPVAALIGITVTEVLRRRRRGFGMGELIALSVCLTIGAALLLGPTSAFQEFPAETALALGGRILLGTIILGTLLQRWGDAETRIGESERRWRALVANVPGAVMQITVNPAGEMSFTFDTAEGARIFGEGALGLTPGATRILQLIHPDDRAAFRRSLVEAGRSLNLWSHEFRVVMPGGQQRWLSGRAIPHPKGRGSVVWDGIVVNVTSRKDVEQVLRRSEALHRLLAENTMEVIGRIGPDQSWLYLSPSSRDILGYEPRALVGRSWLYIVEDADIPRVKDAMTRLVPGGPALTIAYRVRRKDGAALWVEETRRLTGGTAEDEPAESISVIRPIEPKRAEPPAAAVSTASAPGDHGQFARMLEAANAGIIVTDANQTDHPVIFVNAAATAITGYSRAELIGRSWGMLQGPESPTETVADIEEAVRQQRPLSTTFVSRRKDGASYWAKLDFSPVRDAEGHVNAYVSVFVDISEQKRIEDELRRARDAAEEANQAKSDFIANISHELRTPLNGVIGFTNLLLNENLPAEQRRYATFAHDAGSSLLAIINNILDLSKIEAGKLTLVETDFSVIELAVSCNTVVWHAARERGLDLNFVLKPDVVNLVRGDPDRIRQVLLNLLSNAIKFTEKGSVVLAISKVEDLGAGTVLKFSITDTGIGIAKEQQSRLFQKFSQIEDKAGVYLRGTGLGLAICKNLVEQMGGSIGATSELGVGSNFWFTVPLKVAAGGGEKPGQVTAGVHRGTRILLVEDTPMNQELMITLLRRAGHEVEVVGDGEAAVAAARRQGFDLILMDVQLPLMDGLSATRAIRQLGTEASRTPIIAMTARALPGDVEKCLAAGMDDHLSKPVDVAALLAIIDRWVGRPHANPHQTSPPEKTGESVQDRDALRDLEAHIGRIKLDELIARAREELPRLLSRMNEHRSDRLLVEQDAHELVSVAGMAGLQELVERARAVMEACRTGNDERIATMLAALNDAGERAAVVLDVEHRASAE
ncbi:MAG: PAS domain S-box protein [Stellaceae bacterium]